MSLHDVVEAIYDDIDDQGPQQQEQQEPAHAYGSQYVCTLDGIYDRSSMSDNKTRKQVKFIHPHMHHHLHQFLKAEVIDYFNPGMVKMVFLKTMVKVNGTIYRADPGGALSNSFQCGRHDWVSIHWARDDVCRDVRKITQHRGIPARINTFLDVPYITAECQDDMLYFYDGEGLYAVVASFAESLYATTTSTDGSEINHRCHQATQLVFHSQLEVDPKFSIPSSPGVKDAQAACSQGGQ
jgi:hypothetical protein